MSNSRSYSRVLALAAMLLLGAVNVYAQTVSQTSDPHVLRVWGYAAFGPLLLRWEDAYTKAHPEMRFHNELHAPATVMAGLYDRVGDVALMGRELWPVETMAYHWVYQQNPFGVTVATAGLNAPGQAFTPVVLVNARNPLNAITLSQLDAIYGSEHRNAPANVRTWGDLGLSGEWATRPVHAYGFGPEDALGVYFRHDVLKMDFKPNAESHLLSDHDMKTPAAERIARAVASDLDAIGYARAEKSTATKALAINDVHADRTTLETHEYPMTRSIGLYFLRFSDKPVEPKIGGFVQFVLSAEGQSLIRPEDGLLPLAQPLVEKEVKRLHDPMPKETGAQEDQ